MHTPVTNPDVLTALQEKIQRWIREKAGEAGDIAAMVTVTAAVEYPVYRLHCRTLTETRSLAAFSRPDSTPVPSGAAPVPPGSIDVWSFPGEEVRDFINFRQAVDIPSTFTAIPCRTCEGKGAVLCTACQGEKTTYCGECRGDKRLPCPKCLRTGKITCAKCKGHGKVYNELTKLYDVCEDCSGKGHFPCDCTSGYITCRHCGGKGRLPCASCGETGSSPCGACGGKGQTLSGSTLEIVFRPREERQELPNPEIPAPVLSALGSHASFAAFASAGGAAWDPSAPEIAGLPPDVRAGVERCVSGAGPANSRMKAVKISVEKKSLVQVNYRIGTTEGAVWAADNGTETHFEQKLMADIFAESLADIRAKAEGGDMAGAEAVMRTLRGAQSLEGALAEIRRTLRRRQASSYLYGTLAAVALASGVALPLLYRWRHASLHWAVLLAGAFCVHAAAGAGVFGVLAFLRPRFFDTTMKRAAAAALGTLGMLAVFYGAAPAGLHFDPRALDGRQMQAEYKEFFPFGLRTLSNQEDIAFLERLVRKYEPTGIDVSGIRKDLDWMKGKQQEDTANLRKIEQLGREIVEKKEEKSSSGEFKLPRRRSPRIVIE